MIGKFMTWLAIAFTLVSCVDHKMGVRTFENNKKGKVVSEKNDVETLIQNAIMDEDRAELESLFETTNINEVRTQGQLPLEFAISQEKITAIRILRNLGADNQLISIDSLKYNDWLATVPPSKKKLIRAVSVDFDLEKRELAEKLKGNNFKLVKAFLDEGVELNSILDGGESALTLSIKGGHMMSLRALFLFKEIDVNRRNERNESPLKLARDFKLTAIEAELLRRGAKDE